MDIQAIPAGSGAGLANRGGYSVWLPLLFFVVFALATAVSGYMAFQRYRDTIKSDSQHELSGIAALKIRQITTWMMERKGDAQALRDDPLFAAEVERWLQRGAPDGKAKEMLTERLASLQRAYAAYGCSAISLFDDRLRPRLASDAGRAVLRGNEKNLVLESMRSGQTLFSDLHRENHRSGEVVEIDFVVPLAAGRGKNARSIGAILFHADPARFLFPLIQQWPTPSASAENLLVRREGNEVVFLNELRHRNNTALSMRLPVTQPELPAAMALLGREGLMEGLDYRSVPVVAVLHKVPGTAWVMVSKIDKAEIYAPVDRLAVWVAVLVLTLTAGGGGAAYAWWRQQRNRIAELQRQNSNEAEKRLLGEAVKQSNGAIALTDRDNRFIYVNPAFARLFGYSLEEAQGKTVDELIGIAGDPSVQPAEAVASANRDGMLQKETLRRTRDGRSVPVLLSLSAVRDGRGEVTNYIASITDLTRHKQAAEALRKQKQFIRLIVDSDPNLIFAKDADGRFLFANEAMARSYGQTTGSIVGKSNRELVSSEELAASYDTANREVLETVKQREAIEEAKFADGRKRWFRTIRKPLVQDDGSMSVLTIATDITDLKESEIALQKFNRVLRMLGSYNAALVHIEEEQGLLTEICRLIVETAGYRMAWVGFAEHDEACSVRPVAHYGFEEGYLENANISWADTERGRGPTGAAIRTGVTQVNQSFLNNPLLAPWREDALARGYQSNIAIPLDCEGKGCGVLTIYSSEAGAFDADEVALLEELADNLAFGISTLRARAERTQAVERLRQSEEHFRFLTERATDMVYLMSIPSGRYEYVSPVATQLFGYTPDEFYGSPMLIRRIVHPDWRAYLDEQWQRLLTGEMPPSYEYQVVHKSGQIRWVSQHNSPIRSGDGSGALIAILGVVADITERKLAEAQLEEQRLRLRTLVQTIPDLVWLKDPDGVYLSCNPQFERFFGAVEAEIVGKTDYDFVDAGLADFFRQKDREAMAAGKPSVNEEWITYADTGERALLETIKTPVRDESGRLIGVMGIARDISERRYAEDALQRQKDFMAQVLDTDPNLVFVKNADGHFIWVNHAMAEACGTTVQDMIWKHNNEVYPSNAQEMEGFLKTDREVIRERREVVVTESARLSGGEQRWYRTIKRPLVENDGSVNVLGIAMDITEQRLSEERLADSYRELQRLASHLDNVREEERTRIARELHDEMGATLAAMKMRVAWLASKLPAGRQELTEEVKHISELVADGIQTVRQIVHKLRPSPLEDVGLTAAIEDYVKKFQLHTGIECLLTLPAQELALEQEQAATLFRILQESLSNVAKHAQASQADIILTRKGKSLLLVIEDNGIGFEHASKEKSFGLLGIRERALMMGGKARVGSAPGKGTRISVSMPVSPAPDLQGAQ
jgi:PAS domain S-box-containing protein